MKEKIIYIVLAILFIAVLIGISLGTGKKAEKTKDEKDAQVVFEKMGEIIEIATELEKRSSEGDKKAKEELDKWDKMLKEMKPQV